MRQSSRDKVSEIRHVLECTNSEIKRPEYCKAGNDSMKRKSVYSGFYEGSFQMYQTAMTKQECYLFVLCF